MGVPGQYTPIANLSGLPAAQLQAWYTTATTELLLRTTTGRVQSGSSAAQSYGMHVMSDQALIGLINKLADLLGFTEPMAVMRPNFSCSGPPPNSEFSPTGIPI